MPIAHAADPRRLSDFIRERKDRIVEEWISVVGGMRPAKGLSRPVLLDHIPEFLDDLSAFVGEVRQGHDVAPSQDLPTIHALERLDLGYDLTEVVSEYSALRKSIVGLAVREGAPAIRSAEMPRLHEAIDRAIATSVQRYTMARERTLRALDRISTAAFGVHDPAGFLPRTLAVLLETTAAVDSISVLLVEDGALRVKASVGLAEEHASARQLRRGECFAGLVWETNTPLLSRDAESDPRVVTDTIRKQGTHALYGVPLLFGDEQIGVVMMGSCSTFDFSDEDLLLFRAMVNRAAAIIAQARLDTEVQRQKTLYETMLQAQSDVGEAFVMFDGPRIVYANDACCRMLGRTADEVRALTLPDLLAPDEILPSWEQQRERFPGRRPREHFETQLLHKDGHRVDVEISIKRVDDRRPLSVAIARDISERKQAEREQARLHEELAQERARVEAILEHLPIGVIFAEAPSGRVVRGNSQVERILRHPILPTADIAEYRHWKGFHEDGKPYQPQEWPLARALLHGEVVRGEEIRYERGDGTLAVLSASAAPVRAEGGRIVAAVVAFDDVTDRKKDADELRASVALRDQIMSVLSHDLRQPLSVISMSASLLLRKEELEAHSPIFTRQLRNAERIERMIGDLLDYARAKHGGVPLRRVESSLEEIVRQVVDSMQVLHPDREFPVRVEGDCAGQWDVDRMAQVFSNLLGNAAAYSPRGTPIEVRLTGAAGSATACVHNQGQPIPPELLSVIFDPFRRARRADHPSGLGLGLYIVREIVAAHGGTVGVESAAGAGTTFCVKLPR
ncbi:MAG: hypothetical protein NVS4B10_01430 [Myxococcales bacterium]